uniref:Uncharacterized protein n=1 Tax=Rhodococcus sp. NS1 TaxID=402236 RepID=A0A097SQC4_9NOCA|nr:hypothetical protein LRS1606.299 [Rhodococcus sp. NS1]
MYLAVAAGTRLVVGEPGRASGLRPRIRITPEDRRRYDLAEKRAPCSHPSRATSEVAALHRIPGLGMIADTWAHLGDFGPWQCALVRSGSAYAPLRRWPIRCRIDCRCPHMHRESVQGVKQYRWNRVVAPPARHRSMQCERDRRSVRRYCRIRRGSAVGRNGGPAGALTSVTAWISARRRHDCTSDQSQKLDREVPRFCASSDRKLVRLIGYRCRAFTYKKGRSSQFGYGGFSCTPTGYFSLYRHPAPLDSRRQCHGLAGLDPEERMSSPGSDFVNRQPSLSPRKEWGEAGSPLPHRGSCSGSQVRRYMLYVFNCLMCPIALCARRIPVGTATADLAGNEAGRSLSRIRSQDKQRPAHPADTEIRQ